MMHDEFFQMLKNDHEELKGLLGQLASTKESAPKKREALFQKLKEALVPHMKAEESAFYMPLLAKKEARENTMEGAEEHHVANIVLKELEKMPKGEEKWGVKMGVFKELVEHHIEEEERKIFKSAEEALDPDEIQTIMKAFSQDKKKVRMALK